MAQDSFVSLNIVNDNIIEFKKFPIIFYWDGKSDIEEDIKNNESFYNIVKSYINSKSYDSIKLYLTYVNDSYGEKEINLQDIYPIDENNLASYYKDFVLDIFYDLYNKVFKSNYEIPIDDLSFENILADIYEEIENKIEKKISKKTFINYILSQLDEKTNLSYKNKESLINIIAKALKES